jgi:hypothetical protein
MSIEIASTSLGKWGTENVPASIRLDRVCALQWQTAALRRGEEQGPNQR